MTIDYSKIKMGDEVGVRVLAYDESDNTFRLDSGPDFAEAWVRASAIVSRTPAPRPALKVGDRVRDLAGRPREIIWLELDRAFLRPTPDSLVAPAVILSEVETWERV